MMRTLILAGVAAMALASCTAHLSPYTTRLHQEMNLDPYTMQRVQFYISKDIYYRYWFFKN